MKKTFVFDIDGTLFTKEWKILPESVEAIKLLVSQGHDYILASGRPVTSLKTITETLPVPPIYLIGSNGSNIYDVSIGKVILEQSIHQDFIDDMMKIEGIEETKMIFQKPLVNFGYNLSKKDYDRLNSFSLGAITSICRDDLDSVGNTVMIGLTGWNEVWWPKYNKQLTKMVEKHDLRLINMQQYDFVDIFPKEISKAEALKHLESKGIISSKNSYAFGDGYNDLEMLKWSSSSYAMSNAGDEVKAVATKVIGNHNEPTIANEIYEILKK